MFKFNAFIRHPKLTCGIHSSTCCICKQADNSLHMDEIEARKVVFGYEQAASKESIETYGN